MQKKLHRSSLAASGKMIKRKKHPVIGCFFFVQILACFDGYSLLTWFHQIFLLEVFLAVFQKSV